MQDPQAWSLVLQWAKDNISYPHLVESFATFGDRYILSEWKDLFNHVFTFSDPGEDIEDTDRIPLAVAAVEAAMVSHGVSFSQPGPSVEQGADPVKHDRKGKRKALDPLIHDGEGKRKAPRSPRLSRPKKRTCSNAVNRFIDLEAQASGEEESESSEEEEDTGTSLSFILASEDLFFSLKHLLLRIQMKTT